MANQVARQAGASDFYDLCKRSNIEELGKACVYSHARFRQLSEREPSYWAATYAITNLMVLNSVHSLDDQPRAKSAANNAAELYAAQFELQVGKLPVGLG